MSPRFEGPLFGRLADIRIQQAGLRWQLAPELQERWGRLEANLWSTANILMRDRMTSLHFQPFPLPTTFGYLRTHKNQRFALKCARKSRDAFVILGSLCSFAIALNPSNPHDVVPKWIRLLHENRVHPAWVENLRKTEYADLLDTQRYGAVIHPNCGWLNHIPTMRARHVPLWFYWAHGDPHLYQGKAGALHTHPFRPDEEKVAALRAADTESSQTSQAPPLASQTVHSMHEKNSRQIPGESWKDYFKRQDEVYRKAIEVETQQDRQSRLNRERNAATHVCPGAKGAHVFEWEQEDGVFLRVTVGRRDVENIWACYSKDQRRFDSIHNEWDLCGFLGPGPLDDEYEYDRRPPLPPSVSPHHWQQDLTTEYQDYRTPGLVVPVWNPSLEDVLFCRYGFIRSIGHVDNMPAGADKFADVKTVFGHRNAFLENTANQVPIIEFYHSLRHRNPIPPTLCDLSHRHEDRLADQLRGSNVIVSVSTASGNSFYFLEPRIRPQVDAPYQIAVKDPVTAVQFCRSERATSRSAIANILLSRGMQFNTFMELPMLIPAFIPYNFMGLGRRPKGHIPDRFDYMEYEERLAAFLQKPHARAAFLTGGLVWRLAKEVLGSSGDQFVLSGPSEHVGQFGYAMPLVSAGTELWDDCLSETELHLVCGLYQIYTGEVLPRCLL